MRHTTLLPSQLMGLFAGAGLGAVRAHGAAQHLLAQNAVLVSAGIPALPGPGHQGVLGSWGSGAAGAVFFGPTLGLGAGTLLGLLVLALRTLPGPWGRRLPWAILVAPLVALIAGDPGLSLFLAIVAVTAGVTVTRAPPWRELLWHLGLSLVVVAGLAPWAMSPEGPFTRVRDRFLLAKPSGLGLALDELYYSWTLYPAEALKPLAARTQPQVAVKGPPDQRDAFCEQLFRQGPVCVPPWAETADLPATYSVGGWSLGPPGQAIPWPTEAKQQAETWRTCSRTLDDKRPLRRATAIGLFWGLPATLGWALGAVAWWLGVCVPPGAGRRSVQIALALALATALAGTAGAPPWLTDLDKTFGPDAHPDRAAIERALTSDRPAERFRAAKAAGALGPAGTDLLLEAVTDPVINVRYAAARALGDTRTPLARETLLRILGSREAWYVKERAYAGLRRMGWRPR